MKHDQREKQEKLMPTQTPKHHAHRPVFSPLSVLALGLALIAICIMAARPPSASAHGAAAVLTPPPVTPPPSTPPTYPDAPHLPISGIPGVSATGGPVTQAEVMTFVQQQRFLPHTLASQRGTIMSIQEETARQVADTRQNTGQPDDTLLWVAELSGHFVFPGSSQQPDGLPFPYAFEVFIASNGNLVMDGGLAQPLTAPPPSTPTPTPAQPTAQPTATPTPAGVGVPTPTPTSVLVPHPTPTSVPQNPPKISVTPTATSEYCANDSYPNSITVMNAGSGTLTWSATAPSGVTLTPSSGSLAAGASQTVTLTGSFTSANSFVVHFTSNGGPASVTITCQVFG
jgi:hypothetical protein